MSSSKAGKTYVIPAIFGTVIALLLCVGASIALLRVPNSSSPPAVSLQGASTAEKSVTHADSPAMTVEPRRNLAGYRADSVARAPTPSNAGVKASSGMAWIPGGKFLMGSPAGAGDSNEYPRHPVIVDGFYMDTTEVMQSQYERVMGSNPSHFKGCPDCPVENVTWHEAKAYCEKLGRRLPSEAQWEFACRAGSSTSRYWGEAMDDAYAWDWNNSEQKTHPVGLKKPNRLGLYDMIGNVWEWCDDWFDSTYYKKSPSSNPRGPDSGMHRVFRGGSWLSDAATLRCGRRDGAVPEDRSNLFGFRCVSSP